MSTLEYVASGTAHLGLGLKRIHGSEKVTAEVNKIFSELNRRNDHNFSILFNAFTEKRFGEAFLPFKESVHKIHADSGGLQIITQGKEVTPEIKDDVYHTQANYSDIAMSFDVIPVKTVSDRSDRNDTKNRYFDITNLEWCASESGKNIKRQIEVFLDEKSKAKPILIAQGNCYETYMKWVDLVMKEIPSSYYNYLGGVAIGAAALGTGPLEDIQRAAFVSEFPNPSKYIHILGVGSVRRLLPYLVFIQNGYYKEKFHISYDSSTHTSGASLGHYFEQGKLLKLGKTMSQNYHHVYDQVESIFRISQYDIDLKYFYEIIANRDYSIFTKNENYDEEEFIKFTMVILSYIGGSIDNFTAMVNHCKTSKKYLLDVSAKMKVDRDMASLYNVTDLNEFLEWDSQIGQYVKSAKITSKVNESLEGLF